ncbi:MAG: hypothetical protein Unbinned1007contig1000_21 [Prokaryotic dsDNA virus sp.]|nr:MAG: hypothetical protein Unbinned1007contig1000_21 [Prokaryotic dsDNA virus sp.]|tara:strand:+ start:15401 stop:15667 length:267 start_codon:yes stop_codon:yes gene_type:complete
MNSKFSYNMSIAKEIHKDKIREARQPLLTKLDIEFQRAIETSTNTDAIVAKKNALRDAPNVDAITNATSTEDLRKQWDSSILGSSPYV